MLEVLFHQAAVQGNRRYADVDQARTSLSQQVAVGTRQGTTLVSGALGRKHKPLNGINLNHLFAQ